ncbi:MAG: NAD(P)-dependent oxidoreductase [Gammaproteobacteria bacterium]|nr:NAD(P)-dependent oxidoreductase [Gammaproteobacteria bacterium]
MNQGHREVIVRVLITGGSGFIGTNLVEYYVNRGHAVVNVDIAAPKNPEHGNYWIKTDIRDAVAISRQVQKFRPDILLHMAARTDLFGKDINDYEANTAGVSNIISAVKSSGSVRLAIFASSMLVCRIGYRPTDEFDYCASTAYGESKVEGEWRVRREAGDAFPWLIVRPTSIWGPWFASPYRDFFTAVQRGWYVHPAGRRIRRSYGFVLNTVHQIDRLIERSGGDLVGKAVYIADYEPIELKSWANEVQRCLRAKPVREVPLWAFQIAAKIGDFFKSLGWNTVPMSSFRLNNLLTEMIHDTAPVHSVCGPLPYTMPEAVSLTCDWLRSNDGGR